MKKSTALASLAASALILFGTASASASSTVEPPPDLPGICFVFSGGGWLGAPCPDDASPGLVPPALAPADPVEP